MDLKKAKEIARGDSFHTETIAFRIDLESKEKFMELCKEHNISVGRLMRAFVAEMLEENK